MAYLSLVPFFNGEEFGDWKWMMKNYLDSEGVELWYDFVENECILPPRERWSNDEKKINGKHKKAIHLISNSLCDVERRRIQDCESAFAIWNALVSYHEGSQSIKTSKLRILTTEFETFDWQPDDSVKTMTDRMVAMVNELKKHGKIYSKEEVHFKMLYALPRAFRSKAVAIEETHDLDKITTEDLIGKLLQYEMQLVKDREIEAPRVMEVGFQGLHLKKKKGKKPMRSLQVRWDDSSESEKEEEQYFHFRHRGPVHMALMANSDAPNKVIGSSNSISSSYFACDELKNVNLNDENACLFDPPNDCDKALINLNHDYWNDDNGDPWYYPNPGGLN